MKELAIQQCFQSYYQRKLKLQKEFKFFFFRKFKSAIRGLHIAAIPVLMLLLPFLTSGASYDS